MSAIRGRIRLPATLPRPSERQTAIGRHLSSRSRPAGGRGCPKHAADPRASRFRSARCLAAFAANDDSKVSNSY
eukprot:scaffold2858_cov659-Pavlova_lutheri.AAC.160